MWSKGMIRTCVLVSLLPLVAFSALVTFPEEASAFTPHAPISINGNGDFLPANGITGGSGTSSDPYVIAGWEINASTSSGIKIRNTNAHFIIRDVYVHSGFPSFRDGIVLFNTINGSVNNATISNNFRGIFVENSSGTTISNCSAPDNGNGIKFLHSGNITIVDNNAFSNIFFGIQLESSDNSTITGNNVSYSRDGIRLYTSNNATVSGNRFAENGLIILGYDLHSYVSHSITPDNIVNGLPLHYYKNCNGLDIDGIPIGQLIVANCTNVKASNLKISDTDIGVQMAFVDGAIITSGIFSSSNHGVDFYYLTNGTIKDSTISSHVSDGIDITRSENVEVSGNNIFSNNGDGIDASWSDNITITGNNLSDDEAGANVRYSSRVVITANSVSINEWYGVLVDSSTDVTISENDVKEHNEWGILLERSENLVIAGNNLSNNYRAITLQYDNNISVDSNNITSNVGAIGVGDSTNVTIVSNIISDNDRGPQLFSSNDIFVRHNSFISNIKQAYDDMGSQNYWDDGYPSGGNYWSDYAGSDEFSGPSQDQPGNDGIGDTPYVIDTDSQDMHPLMAPLPGVNNPPVASFSISPTSGNVTVTFTVNASSSSDLQDPSEALEVRWDWEDDGTWDTTWSSAKEAQHQYSVPDNYTIRLEVRDIGGFTNQTAKNLIVSNLAPNCTILDPMLDATVIGILTVEGEAFDSDGSVEFVEIRIDNGNWTQATGTTAWTYRWDTASVPDGQHTIHARSYDGMDYSAEVSITVTIDNLDPRDSGQDWLWVAAGAIIVVVVAILLALLILRKKKDREEQGIEEMPIEEDSENRI